MLSIDIELCFSDILDLTIVELIKNAINTDGFIDCHQTENGENDFFSIFFLPA